MRTLPFIFLLCLSLASCNGSGARDRSKVGGVSSNGSSFAGQYPDDAGRAPGGIVEPESNGSFEVQGNGEDVRVDGGPSSFPPEVAHCKWNSPSAPHWARNTKHLGRLNICQHKTNDSTIYLQLDRPVTSTRLCVIPMFEIGNKSIYIGNPMCTFVPDSKVYKVDLLKNRGPDYQQYKVTGVMLIKDTDYQYPYPFSTTHDQFKQVKAVDAFLQCSQAMDRGNGQYCYAFTSINEHVYHSFLSGQY